MPCGIDRFARIEGLGCSRIFRASGFDQDNIQHAIGKGQGKRDSGRARADDHKVGME